MALQTDVAKNSLWRSSTVITPRTGGSNTHHNKGKSPMTKPSFKRPRPSSFGQNHSGSQTALEAVAIKVPQAIRGRGDSLRMLKQILKGLRSLLLSTRI
jgi:hypothetical protein